MPAEVTFATLDWIVLGGYFALILGVGLAFARFSNSTQDFFFGGRRFPWWLVSVSCVATLVGSYSFIQYAEVGFSNGLSAISGYTNDWFVLPLFVLVWLPIVYFRRIMSIPEYFARRFDERTRILVLVILLVYLEGYVGINLLTIGQVLHGLLGWPVIVSAAVMALVSAVYLHAGGQTSVIMTGLLQGAVLLATGLVVVWLGVSYVGGVDAVFSSLPSEHRLPFAGFNEPSSFHHVGVFWADAITATFAFYFINQGVLMRFMSAKSLRDGRRAIIFVVFALMPIVAIAVAGGGWVGRAMVETGRLSESIPAKDVFLTVASMVTAPGLFGLVVAAVVAALMSTLDTLVTAVSAIAVNDIWKRFRPSATDAQSLGAAKTAAALSTVVGIALIPVFGQFDSIYQALSHFIAVTTPPLLVVLIAAILWPGFGARAAFYTLIAGSLACVASLIEPELIAPLAHGVDGAAGYSYMRSLFGIVATAAVAIPLGLLLDRGNEGSASGLVARDLDGAARAFKGGDPSDKGVGTSEVVSARVDERVEAGVVELPGLVAERLQIAPGDMIFVADARWWRAAFRSVHARAGQAGSDDVARIAPATANEGNLDLSRRVRIEKLL